MEIAICDDIVPILEELEEQLKQLNMVDNVYTFSDLDTFLFSVDGGKRYDAVLMDIEWGEESKGIDVAAELYKLSPETKIIYVTAHVELSQHILFSRSNLSGFLTKPVGMELLRENLQKVLNDLPYGEQPSLVLRQKGAPVSVPLREIIFIESKGHTVRVHTAAETLTAYERLENIMRSLPRGFYQCHKSYIVNMSQIRRFQSGDICLKNGEYVPVSRAKYNQTKEAYVNFMGQTF